MTPEMLFEKYYYIVDHYAAAYKLSEDMHQELALYFWEHCLQLTCYGSSYSGTYHHLLRDRAERLTRHVDIPEPPARATPYITACRIAEVDYTALHEALGSLTPREQYALERYYFDNMPLKEIGRELHVSYSRVREVQLEALRKLRKPKFSKALKWLIPDSDYAFIHNGIAYI